MGALGIRRGSASTEAIELAEAPDSRGEPGRHEGNPSTGDNVAGIAVHIGARVGAIAGASQVVVSSTVRDLVVGSGLTFKELGLHQLKGVPGRFWRLGGLLAALPIRDQGQLGASCS